MKELAISLLSIVITLGFSSAEEYILAKKGYIPPAGTTFEENSTFSLKGAVLDIQQGGKNLKGSMQSTEKSTSVIEFVSQKKVIQTITAFDSSTQSKINGQLTPAKKDTNPLLNTPLTFINKDDKWVVEDLNTLSDEAKEKAQEKADLLSANINKSLYGYDARKVGDEWVADNGSLISLLGDTNEIDKASATIKFNSVEKVNNIRIAKFTVTIKAEGKIENGTKLTMEGPLTISRDIDNFIDLDASGKISMTAAFAQGPMVMTVKGNPDMKVSTTIKEPITR